MCKVFDSAYYSSYFLKNKAAALVSLNIMLDNRTLAALFAITIASSLIVVSVFISSAYAYDAKKVKQHEYSMTLPVPFSGLPAVSDKEDKSVAQTSHSLNGGDLSWTIGSSKSIPTKEASVWRKICNT